MNNDNKVGQTTATGHFEETHMYSTPMNINCRFPRTIYSLNYVVANTYYGRRDGKYKNPRAIYTIRNTCAH